jgi:hypothetical protein
VQLAHTVLRLENLQLFRSPSTWKTEKTSVWRDLNPQRSH